MHRLIVLAAALLAPSILLAQSPGWQYATRMTVDSGNGVTRTTTMRQIVTPSALRIEIGGLTESYTIMNEKDSTTLMIMPGSRTATIMPMIRATLSAMPIPKMTPHFTVHTTEDLGPGGPILGHATRHYRTTSQGTVDVTLEGQTCTRAVNDVAEMWTASDVDLKPAMDLVLRLTGSSLADALKLNSANVDPDAAARGYPLKTVLRRSVPTPGGGTRLVTTTLEYTEVFAGRIEDSLFAIPADYRQMDMRPYAGRVKASSTLPPLPLKTFCNT
jgi:hypothetical protein